MFVFKPLDGLRNWLKGRALYISSLSVRCRRLLFLFLVAFIVFVFSPNLRNFHPTKYLGSYHIDQAYVCLENRIAHWKEDIASKDVMVLHKPLKSNEAFTFAFVGNGILGVSLNGNRHLYISDGKSISIEIPYESLLSFTVDEYKTWQEATVLDLRRGLVHNIHSYSKEKSCVVVEHIIYANQEKPTLLVQEIIINNHVNGPVQVKFQHHGQKQLKNSKLFHENFSAVKPGQSSIPLSVLITTINHPTKRDTDLVVAVGSSSIAPIETVPFESVKSLTFLTAVSSQAVPQVKPTTNAQMKVQNSLHKVVINNLKNALHQEESLREDHVSAWRKIWESGVTVAIHRHPDTPAGEIVNLTMYYVLSSLTTTISKSPLKYFPGKCYQGVPTMHTALLWKSPYSETDISDLAMKWKTALTTQGCESFFDRGPVYLHQAMVLSFGGFTFASDHLEFAANPATLQTNIMFHHIECYGNFIDVEVLVGQQLSQAAEIKVWAEKKQDTLFACEAGCQFPPVMLNSAGMTFPVKITSPVTPLLYISKNESHLFTLKNMDFIQQAWKDTRFQSKQSQTYLPATFWAFIAFLIIAFHLYLVKLIYSECYRETRSVRLAR
ncbi:uncharacterized protein KIAA2013 homolog [Xenia sp. Carnegie-2017]|uniref:uncharacterized protein KIAA2013 homolog n=1 Tax=Xenia sp. Carnegie-2017 TaxID=2897299 RepID=UPI001F0397AA|nr:uncharacterized protein KIAA2013 homolog [Xenia sp. Carnegie-2017]